MHILVAEIVERALQPLDGDMAGWVLGIGKQISALPG
jgi:hypothetical protein